MAGSNSIVPETDAGSNSFARFRYQADVTLPYCLLCALGEEIAAVIPEHLEDIAIEYKDRWRFIQVKSRDPERGLWKLSDLLRPKGALHSLFRTYQQTIDVNATLEIALEGAIKRKDPIECLLHDYNHRDSSLVSQVMGTFEITENQAIDFLSRVILVKSPPPRPHIRDCNLQLIHHQNTTLDHNTVSTIYDKLIREIERAMRAERPKPEWPHYLTHPSQMISEVKERLEAKRLTASHLRAIISPVYSSPRYLLRRISNSSSNSISSLESKLIIGGATLGIINQARILRANTQLHWIKLQASSLGAITEVKEDLQVRLQTYMEAHCAAQRSSIKPAIAIWNELLNQFTANPSAIDRNEVLQSDPMLLVGEVCELADLCIVDFGEANED